MESEANPFKNIERIIIIVLVIWLLALVGWFVNNMQISDEQRLVDSAEVFLKKNDMTIASLNCLVDESGEFGNCAVVTSENNNLFVKCPVTSTFSDFASVFFAEGQPCEFVDSE